MDEAGHCGVGRCLWEGERLCVATYVIGEGQFDNWCRVRFATEGLRGDFDESGDLLI